MKKALVVPSNRQDNICCFIEKWNKFKDWDLTIVIEDGPDKTFNIDCDYHFCWADIDKDLGKESWIISRKDSAIRSYGFLKAYEAGADYILTLDDDCFPICDNFFESHIKNLEKTQKWTTSIPDQRTRGVPYKNLGILENVMFSMGLWEGIPDYDSIQTLSGCFGSIVLPKSRVIPSGQYFPFCGMNFCFKKQVIPICLFALMGESSPYRRFDDIWFGIICKKICDHLKYHIVCGEPYIYHSRASDVFFNLIKEAPGIKFNEEFWKIIDEIKIKENSPKLCMKEVGISLQNYNDDYLKKYGKSIEIWSDFFAN